MRTRRLFVSNELRSSQKAKLCQLELTEETVLIARYFHIGLLVSQVVYTSIREQRW